MAPSNFLTPSPVLYIPLSFNILPIFSTLLYLCKSTSENIVEPNDPHISDLLVSHYDCSKQNNLCQFSVTRVQTCEQASLL